MSVLCVAGTSHLTDLANLVLAAVRSNRAQLGGSRDGTRIVGPVLNDVVFWKNEKQDSERICSPPTCEGAVEPAVDGEVGGRCA